jgi:hypothetical protein
VQKKHETAFDHSYLTPLRKAVKNGKTFEQLLSSLNGFKKDADHKPKLVRSTKNAQLAPMPREMAEWIAQGHVLCQTHCVKSALVQLDGTYRIEFAPRTAAGKVK